MKVKTKRLLYVPGLISLLALPIICYAFLNNYRLTNHSRIIDVTYWNSEWNSELNSNYNKSYPYSDIPNRNFNEFLIVGNKEDKNILHSARLAIRKLTLSGDTIEGVRFHFTDHAKYWTLISALDICNIENANIFVPDKSNIWVYNISPDQRIKMNVLPPPILCGTAYYENNIYTSINLNFFDLIKSFWISVILFILMLLISINQFNKFTKASANIRYCRNTFFL